MAISEQHHQPSSNLSSASALDKGLLDKSGLDDQVRAHFRTSFQEMPTLKAHAAEVIQLARTIEDANMVDVVNLLRQDPAAAASIVTRANSAAYRRHSDVTGLDEAVVRVGRREVYAIVTALAMRSLYKSELRETVTVSGGHWLRQQRHAVVSAYASGWLANKLLVPDHEKVFLGGMFHDIGKLGALFCLADLARTRQLKVALTADKVAATLESLHVELGCEMLAHWRMPRYLIEICEKSHDRLSGDPSWRPLHVIRMASCLHTLQEGLFVPPTLPAELEESAAALRLRPEARKSLGEALQVIVEHTDGLM